ncbi:MAG: hypothetical protein HYV63_26250 [Candidatus Schekmanbacteria bacterium]|nr:hypothetical protein [Candidatus Schekmanbacteria bacterium]
MMQRPHPDTGRPLWEMLEQERQHLLPLPAKPYDTRDVVVRIINPTGRVCYQANEYPVGGHVGDRVHVCVGLGRIEICDRHGKRLCEHEHLPDGAGIKLAHPDASSHRSRYNVDELIERLAEWGESAAEFARALRKERRCAGPQLVCLLNLQLEWSLDDIVGAMEHAARYRCHDAAAVARILTARYRPRQLQEVIAESTRRRIQEVMKDHPIRQRPIGSYASLTRGDCFTPAASEENDG